MKPIKHYVQRVVAANKFSESPIESQLFWAMSNNEKFILCQEGDEPQGEGFFLFPQTNIGKYRVDFYLLARLIVSNPKVWGKFKEAKIVIECDGKAFHSREDQKTRDAERDKYLKDNGYEVTRFTGSEIYHHSKFCVDCIIDKAWSSVRSHG